MSVPENLAVDCNIVSKDFALNVVSLEDTPSIPFEVIKIKTAKS